MPLQHLTNIRKRLNAASRKAAVKGSYAIPSLWSLSNSPNPANPAKSGGGTLQVDPFEFFDEALGRIEREPRSPIAGSPRGEWSRDAVIYNMFVRSTCAFDHDQNGKLDLPSNSSGWKETGTFLKAIALLPYVKSLGANVVHLLPITSIGSDGNKGTLGSPYAIKNPYELDRNLGEPNLGLGPEEEFKAFVEAAHHLGIRVVVEFVFRTSAKDGDWVKEHPEWFYWIKAEVRDRPPGSADESAYGPPLFTKEEMGEILKAVEEERFGSLPPPHKEFLELFTIPPAKSSIKLKGGRYLGVLPEHATVRIPGAFADWPPDDGQPPWGDVTFLKMYEHPDFNYIAYNTIRMYDSRLASEENINKPLWKKVADIIPYYQQNFGIDGVMIDMGHALPMQLKKEMISRARAIDPDFAFWDENFSVDAKSVEEGYSAVIGYVWSDLHHPDKLISLLRRFALEGYPIPFFATPESHNTPRAAMREGGMAYSRFAWAISNFIPAIPFIHSGFELSEKFPVNTGLDFTSKDLKNYPSASLPLFSQFAYDWTSRDEMTDWVRRVSAIRAKYRDLVVDHSPGSFRYVDTDNSSIVCFLRHSPQVKHQLCVAANPDMRLSQPFSLTLPPGSPAPIDLLSGEMLIHRDGSLKANLEPGQVILVEL